MKNIMRTAAGVVLPALLLFLANCQPPVKPEGTDNPPVVCDSVCDTLGDGALFDKYSTSEEARAHTSAKYRSLKPWSKGRQYTLCIDAKIAGTDEAVEITLYRKRVPFQTLVLNTSKPRFVHPNSKARFIPEMTIRFLGRHSPEDIQIDTTAVSVCGAVQTVTEKLQSTSSQGSSVLVTVDEK